MDANIHSVLRYLQGLGMVPSWTLLDVFALYANHNVLLADLKPAGFEAVTGEEHAAAFQYKEPSSSDLQETL